MINVSKTNLPSLKEYAEKLSGVWESRWITNNGEQCQLLEEKLRKRFKLKHLFLVTNGTLALQIAIKALDLKGEIITTPFSYIATTSSIVWQGCKPVFCDIDKRSLSIDPAGIESLITPRTSAILATHVYGIPCDVLKIEKIARKHNLRVIYDAAHAFGVNYRDKSILTYGDISTLSFHATKLFHTAEGGAVITSDDELAHRISYMRNFGHKGYDDFEGVGINGKMSELHAVMGLCLLPRCNAIISKHKSLCNAYDALLEGNKLTRPVVRPGTDYNYAYYPLIFPSEEDLLRVKQQLNKNDIFPRRYFHPPLNKLKFLPYQPAPVGEDISGRILCLPLFADLSKAQIKKISNIILSVI
jgi:dTDP-4-amino-4,6-dideoxygalactose transaminase